MTDRLKKMLKLTALASTACLTFATAGCSSSSSLAGNSDLIRTVDAVPDGGSTTVDINAGTVEGNQTFFSASPYLFVNPGPSDFTFTLSSNASAIYPSNSTTLIGNAHYTAVLVGIASATLQSDPRYPQVIVLEDDQTLPPSGNERVRVVNAAPDAGAIDVTIAGSSFVTNLAYPTASPYLNVPAGPATVIVKQDSTGNTISTQQINIASGGATTLYETEPSTPPAATYQAQSVVDF